MNETAGIVERVDGEDVLVRTEGAGAACGACARRGGCHEQPGGHGGALLRLPNTIRARAGDAVVVRAADGTVLRAVWRAYGIPLGLGLAGALAAKAWFAAEPAVLAGLLCGLAAGFLLLRCRPSGGRRSASVLSIDFKRIP